VFCELCVLRLKETNVMFKKRETNSGGAPVGIESSTEKEGGSKRWGDNEGREWEVLSARRGSTLYVVRSVILRRVVNES